MHLVYGSQIRWKEDIFRQVLKRIAHLEDLPPIRIHAAPSQYHYRFRARLHIRGNVVGFYRRASNSIVPWERCMLLPEALNAVVGNLRRWAEDAKVPPVLRSCEAALSPLDGSATFTWFFSGARGAADAVRMVMDGVERAADGSGINLAGQAARDLRGVIGSLRGTGLPLESGGIRTRASPGTFFQVNPDVNAVLVERTLAHLRSLDISSLLDLYCGNGNLSLPAAALGIRTVGVESSPGAVLDARSCSATNGLFVEMDAARFLAQDQERWDAVILDPPRKGLPREVIRMLTVRRFPAVVYISCEPSTLARDLAHLTAAGYVVSEMELFDMFPQTFHSEVLVLMRG